MFQFPGFPPDALSFHAPVSELLSDGFPHSDICGSMSACDSPQLFAAGRVLLRRMAPWHPPCALCSLIFSSLDPETNCSLRLPLCCLAVWLAFWFRSRSLALTSSLSCLCLRSLALPFPSTGLFHLFSLSLCSCQGASRVLSNPENDTGSAQSQAVFLRFFLRDPPGFRLRCSPLAALLLLLQSFFLVRFLPISRISASSFSL